MSPVNQNLDNNIEKNTENTETVYKPPLFSDMTFSAIVVSALYLIGLSVLLSYFYKAGKYSEYAIPFHLLETNIVNLAIVCSILGISSLSAFAVTKLSLPPKAYIKNRTQKITDFFAAITTLAIAFYFISIFSLILKTNSFPIEALYLFIIYGVVVFFYFLKKKSHIGHNLVSSGFIIVLLITSFYLGINVAKTENKLLVTVQDETYGLVASYNDNIILSGYNRSSKKFVGKIKIINNNDYNDLAFIRYKN